MTVKQEQQTRDAIACLAHECIEALDLEPQAVRVTIDLDGGRRLRVTRDLILLGPKKDLADVTAEVREDIARLLREGSNSQIERQRANEERS